MTIKIVTYREGFRRKKEMFYRVLKMLKIIISYYFSLTIIII